MKYDEIVDHLLNQDRFKEVDKFSLLKSIVEEDVTTNDIAILVAMRLDSDEWGAYTEIAAGYVRSRGLFPYLAKDRVSSLSLRDDLARNYFESPTRSDIFMHRAQYLILSKLLSGKSVVLSAPTSFGKSFIIEELLLSGKYKNVVIIVPTIALIEELREKVKRLHTNHNRVSFSQQNIGEENIFILTQERAFDMYPAISQLKIDLLIIDEFYKMDQGLLEKDDGDRANLLNVVYRNYSSIANQVYLLGPYIDGVDGLKTSRHDPIWIESGDNTTYIIKQKLTAKSKERAAVTCTTAQQHQNDVMIYCSSPVTLRDLYTKHLVNYFDVTTDNDDLIDWINQNIGEEWYITDALRHGIGVHHGRLPRFLAHEMIRRFGDGRLKVLLCTSSLIEGVNTNAKTIIIHNSQFKFNGDILTFRNISGRAGRMFKHFWGTVYYYEEPDKTEIIVSDSIGSENSTTSANILNLLIDTQLNDTQAKSVEKHRNNTYIPHQLLQQNKFIDIEKQERLVERLRNSPHDAEIFRSIHSPQLTRLQSATVFEYASILGLNTFKYASAKQNILKNSLIRLSMFIDSYFMEGFRGLARQQSPTKQIDDIAIECAFNFLKNGMSYDFPKYIRAVDRLQQFAITNAGDLEPYANRLEYLDTHPVYIQLDELGLPIEISKKYKLNPESSDLAVSSLSRMVDRLEGFELSVAKDFLSRY